MGSIRFFILSGFVMIYNYLPRCSISAVSLIDNWRFSVRKISKLYSLHILMLVLILFYWSLNINQFTILAEQ